MLAQEKLDTHGNRIDSDIYNIDTALKTLLLLWIVRSRPLRCCLLSSCTRHSSRSTHSSSRVEKEEYLFFHVLLVALQLVSKLVCARYRARPHFFKPASLSRFFSLVASFPATKTKEHRNNMKQRRRSRDHCYCNQ